MSALAPASPVLAATQAGAIALLVEQYEVRSLPGDFLFTVNREQARRGISQGIFRPIGRTCVKYLVFVGDRSRRPDLRGGSRTTRPDRADHTCRTYADGQFFGDPTLLREHKPPRN
jgi:hypothetical protein